MKPAITDLEVNLFFYFLFFSLTVERREMEKVGRTRRILLFSPPRWKWFPSRHAVYLSNTGISRFQRATLFRPIHGQQRMRAYKRTVSTIFFLHAYVYITFHFNRSLVSDPATILPILSRFFPICGSVCLLSRCCATRSLRCWSKCSTISIKGYVKYIDTIFTLLETVNNWQSILGYFGYRISNRFLFTWELRYVKY